MSEQDPILDQEVVQDQFTTTVLQAFGFIRRHSRTVTILIFCVAAGSALFVGWKQNQDQKYSKAAARYRELVEQYNVAETEWLSAEKPEDTKESSQPFDQVSGDLKAFFENANFAQTPFVDRARYNFAKIQFYQGKLDASLNIYRELAQNVPPNNPLIAAYSHQAIGNCYEQKGDYVEAIKAYEKLRALNLDGVDSLWVQHINQAALLRIAWCYEQQEKLQDANNVYTEILERVDRNILQAIDEKSRELIKKSNDILAELELPEPSQAASSISDSYESFESNRSKIHEYKIQKDIEGGLDKEIRLKIKEFEADAADFSDNLEKARDYQRKDRLTNAWRYYRMALGIDGYDPEYGRQSVFDFAPNRKVYETALFHQRRTTTE